MLVGEPRAAAVGSFGLLEGSFSTVLLSHSPTHRHGLARAALPPQDHLLTSRHSCFVLQFYSLSTRAVLPIGGEGLRSPPPCRSGKAPTAVFAAVLPPLVARTAKALSVGAELPASGSSSGKPGERAGAAGAAGAGGECGGSQAGQVADRGAPAG